MIEVIGKIICVDCGTSSDVMYCQVDGADFELCYSCVENREENEENDENDKSDEEE